MIQIDENKIFQIIESNKPKFIALNGPEPLLPKIQIVSEKIEKKIQQHYLIYNRREKLGIL